MAEYHAIRRLLCGVMVLFLSVAANGCATDGDGRPGDGGGGADVPTVSVAKATEIFEAGDEKSRAAAREAGWEAFRSQVFVDPDGKFIVNGDTPILNEKRLREFFDRQVMPDAPADASTRDFARLIVHREGGQDAVWNDADKGNLTYCVSTRFGNRHGEVVATMRAATNAWEAVADVDFRHLPGQDGNCTAANDLVVFDVRPVNVNGQYLARAFFPNEPRSARNILIDDSSFGLDPGGDLSLEGILRHELGHTLGFRHEHTRPESGTCFEDSNWTAKTDYDAFSVMHYPQCNGLGDWTLSLTAMDQSGSACVYGAAPGFQIDPQICDAAPIAPSACPETTQQFSGSVGLRERQQHGPFAVSPGTRFTATMTGSGDPDLYVNYDVEPNFSTYVCRPYLEGADEECVLDIPADVTRAFVMVRGYAAGQYQLSVTFTAGN